MYHVAIVKNMSSQFALSKSNIHWGERLVSVTANRKNTIVSTANAYPSARQRTCLLMTSTDVTSLGIRRFYTSSESLTLRGTRTFFRPYELMAIRFSSSQLLCEETRKRKF